MRKRRKLLQQLSSALRKKKEKNHPSLSLSLYEKKNGLRRLAMLFFFVFYFFFFLLFCVGIEQKRGKLSSLFSPYIYARICIYLFLPMIGHSTRGKRNVRRFIGSVSHPAYTNLHRPSFSRAKKGFFSSLAKQSKVPSLSYATQHAANKGVARSWCVIHKRGAVAMRCTVTIVFDIN